MTGKERDTTSSWRGRIRALRVCRPMTGNPSRHSQSWKRMDSPKMQTRLKGCISESSPSTYHGECRTPVEKRFFCECFDPPQQRLNAAATSFFFSPFCETSAPLKISNLTVILLFRTKDILNVYVKNSRISLTSYSLQ